MKKVIILTPVFNDWKSLYKLLKEINVCLKKSSKNIEILIIDDCSTEKFNKTLKIKGNIKKIKILKLNNNIGSQQAIFKGLKYLYKLKKKGIVAIMDSDGEDDVKALKNMINLARKNSNYVITGNRNSRSEGFVFKLLYNLHLIITFILTGQYLNFGNFSAFNSIKLKEILQNNNLKIAYSAGLKKNIKNLIPFYSNRKKRYFGNSKASFYFLFKHSFNILTVFKNELFLRSLVMSILIYAFNYYNNFAYFLLIIFLILILNIIIRINFILKNKFKI